MKEKRERQPNWTEHEKQLLLSLTRKHQAILENKGSDAITLRHKAAAWNEIALHMNAAGYNRSKERLKQQMGRIRAAEAKRVKEVLEKPLVTEENDFNFSAGDREKPNDMQLKIYNKCNENIIISPPRTDQDELQIKAERTPSTDNDSNVDELNCISAQSETFTTVNDGGANHSTFVSNSVMRSVLETFQSLTEIKSDLNNNKDATNQIVTEKADLNLALHDAGKIDVPYPMNHGMDEQNRDEFSQEESVVNKKTTSRGVLHRARSNRLKGFPTLSSKERRIRQIHMYRVAVERERLRALKTQQKRERILHRKDVQIQNLKLQILRNLINQTPDGNRINF